VNTSLLRLGSGMFEAANTMRQATERIQELETALNRMVLMFENTLSDSEGRYPAADAGCIDCTCGTVPDKYNTGPCAFHAAKRLLGQL
jgi:hypothetical protein